MKQEKYTTDETNEDEPRPYISMPTRNNIPRILIINGVRYIREGA